MAPSSITIMSTASVVTPRAVAEELPSAAMSRPKAEAITAQAIEMPRKPSTRPWMRTRNTTIAQSRLFAEESGPSRERGS